MSFVKGKDELKRIVACLSWFLITFSFGFLASYIFIFLKYKTKFDDFLYVSLAAGWCTYSLTIIISCSIKSIKAGPFEITNSKTDINSKTDSNSNNFYKIFYYGISPYVANRLNIDYPNDLHPHKDYHLCEIKIYEIIAKRRAWNIFCPFIETEILTVEEIDDIINSVKP